MMPKAMNTQTTVPTIPNAGCFNPPCCSIIHPPFFCFTGFHAKNPVVNTLNPFPLIDVKHNGVDNEQDTKKTLKTFF
jgi:hypothetical protein